MILSSILIEPHTLRQDYINYITGFPMLSSRRGWWPCLTMHHLLCVKMLPEIGARPCISAKQFSLTFRVQTSLAWFHRKCRAIGVFIHVSVFMGYLPRHRALLLCYYFSKEQSDGWLTSCSSYMECIHCLDLQYLLLDWISDNDWNKLFKI